LPLLGRALRPVYSVLSDFGASRHDAADLSLWSTDW